ncbi:hypothetical protein SS50377_22088 [Spironucleus salmonicida]|uniref:Uncharacterized protein n=1 Tax=Spironucleus salmonicida TaxID=348837 RepID=V6LM90_9EUKA|nr:hypothetical protein SS50377_22088 [Spironucleus salmonicida]|eukprot:EST45750.1 Hypothetical protein SS50377_14321 [Spironucleus salmonicida]
MDEEQNLTEQQLHNILKGKLYQIKLLATQNYKHLIEIFQQSYLEYQICKERKLMQSNDIISQKLSIPNPFESIYLSDSDFLHKKLELFAQILKNYFIQINTIENEYIKEDLLLHDLQGMHIQQKNVLENQNNQIEQLAQYEYQINDIISYDHIKIENLLDIFDRIDSIIIFYHTVLLMTDQIREVIADTSVFEFEVLDSTRYLILQQQKLNIVDPYNDLIDYVNQQKQTIQFLILNCDLINQKYQVLQQDVIKVQRTQNDQTKQLQISYLSKIKAIHSRRLSLIKKTQTQLVTQPYLCISPRNLHLRHTTLLSLPQEAKISRIQRELRTPRAIKRQ